MSETSSAIDLRPIRPIEGFGYRFRTFHHPRDYAATSGGDDRPANTLDQIIEVTLPLIRSVWPDVMPTRRIML